MTTFTHYRSDLFNGAFAAVAMIGPILLIIAASAMPVGPETGDFIVSGHGALLAVLATALVLRVAYAVGFTKGLKIVASEGNYSPTA